MAIRPKRRPGRHPPSEPEWGPSRWPSPTISRSVLADQVKDRLLEAILNGTYPPDSRIVETQVARELGTSQAPVREALRGLEALGVVEITPVPRRPGPPPVEARDHRGVRRPVDARGARQPARGPTDDRGGRRRARPATSRRCGAAARDDDGHGVAEADARFHGRIVELADNGTLVRVWRRSSRSRGRTSRSSSPAPTRSGRPTSTPRSSTRSSGATPKRSSDALRAALRRGQRQHGAPLAGRRSPATPTSLPEAEGSR